MAKNSQGGDSNESQMQAEMEMSQKESVCDWEKIETKEQQKRQRRMDELVRGFLYASIQHTTDIRYFCQVSQKWRHVGKLRVMRIIEP